MSINQVDILKNFFNTKDKNLIINNINESITSFYVYLIKYFATKGNFRINDIATASTDLFEINELKIFFESNIKTIEKYLETSFKKIIFTNYKNFQKFKLKIVSINSYQYEKDIHSFFINDIEIDNMELINFCKNNPELIFSETSKFLTNRKNYTKDHNIQDDRNHILNIRKEIFSQKKSNSGLKKLYQSIKEEGKYKKLSFLTY